MAINVRVYSITVGLSPTSLLLTQAPIVVIWFDGTIMVYYYYHHPYSDIICNHHVCYTVYTWSKYQLGVVVSQNQHIGCQSEKDTLINVALNSQIIS